MRKLLAVIASGVALAACSSTATHTAAGQPAAASRTASPAARPTPSEPVPVLTADPQLVSMYLGQVTPVGGETVIAAARRVCREDRPQMAAQIPQIPVPSSWPGAQNGYSGTSWVAWVDLHGPGPVTVHAGQSFPVSIGPGATGGDFTQVNANEAVCSVTGPASTSSG